jgi:hypothetical protein
MPSESIAELPVNAAAANFIIAMAKLPPIAAKIAVLDSAAIKNHFQKSPVAVENVRRDFLCPRRQAFEFKFWKERFLPVGN